MDFEYEKVSTVVAVVAMTENDFQERVSGHADIDKEDLYPTACMEPGTTPQLVRQHIQALIVHNPRLGRLPVNGNTVVNIYGQHTLYVWFQHL